MTTTTTRKADLSKAGTPRPPKEGFPDSRAGDGAARLKEEISAKEYRSIKANLKRQEAAILALAS